MRLLVVVLERYRSAGNSLLLVLIAVALCALAVVEADRPLAGAVKRDATPALVELANALVAATFPAALILVAVLVHQHAVAGGRNVQKKSDVQYIRVALSAALAAGCAAILQPIFGRTGPNAHLADGVYGFAYFSGSMGLSSFPSVYAAGVGAIAAASWAIVPPYRPTVILLTALAVGSQVVSGSHFLGDQLAGLTIGWCAFETVKKLFERRSAVRSNAR
jgi:membrane-associated phospholipid phosphatase